MSRSGAYPVYLPWLEKEYVHIDILVFDGFPGSQDTTITTFLAATSYSHTLPPPPPPPRPRTHQTSRNHQNQIPASHI